MLGIAHCSAITMCDSVSVIISRSAYAAYKSAHSFSLLAGACPGGARSRHCFINSALDSSENSGVVDIVSITLLMMRIRSLLRSGEIPRPSISVRCTMSFILCAFGLFSCSFMDIVTASAIPG